MIRVLIATLGLITSASGGAPARGAEPEYGGKSLSAWSETLTRKGATKPERRDAAWAMYMIGPKAVPALVVALENKNWEVRSDAKLVLDLLGEDAIPALTKAMRSPNEELRTSSWLVLKQMGPRAKTAVPELVKLLEEKDASAMEVLLTMGPSAKEALPALAKVLADTDTSAWKNPIQWLGYDRRPSDWACFTLQRLGVMAIPTLTEALGHTKIEARRTAIEALCFMLAVHDKEPAWRLAQRLEATEFLRGSGAESKAARVAIIRGLADEDEDVRRDAASVLRTCGPAAKDGFRHSSRSSKT